MPVEERRRLALRDRVSASWGEEAADTLFELLAPAGQDPATRQDVHQGFAQVDRRFAALEERMDHRFEVMEERFVALEERMDHRFAAFEERMDHRFVALEERMDHRFAAMEDRFEARSSAMGEHFERRISDAVTTQTRTLVISQLAALVAIAGLAFGLG